MKKTAKELAAAVGATVEGNGDLELSAVASPERAGPRDLIYADSAKNVPAGAGFRRYLCDRCVGRRVIK